MASWAQRAWGVVAFGAQARVLRFQGAGWCEELGGLV